VIGINNDLGKVCHITGDSYFLPIPKNASTAIANDLGATEIRTQIRVDPLTFGSKDLLIVLRDPWERWVSGVIQLWESKLIQQRVAQFGLGYFGQYWQEAVDQVAIDPHTYPQVTFIIGFDTSNATWVWLDGSADAAITEWAGNRGVEYLTSDDNNATIGNFAKDWVSEKIRVKVLNNPEVLTRVCDFYKLDYELISSVDFINK
jgi:hypothetical protein